jgi:hypothetical protein
MFATDLRGAMVAPWIPDQVRGDGEGSGVTVVGEARVRVSPAARSG